MLEMNITASRISSGSNEMDWALGLYRRFKAQAELRRLFNRLIGRASELRQLTGDHTSSERRARGVHAVSIAEIVGSEDRSGDFDAGFAPLQEHSRSRWLNVAMARRRGLSLPAVVLRKAEDGYYVRDGHHRISVARALGEEFIEADIVA